MFIDHLHLALEAINTKIISSYAIDLYHYHSPEYKSSIHYPLDTAHINHNRHNRRWCTFFELV